MCVRVWVGGFGYVCVCVGGGGVGGCVYMCVGVCVCEMITMIFTEQCIMLMCTAFVFSILVQGIKTLNLIKLHY